MPPLSKVCSKCGLDKPFSDFSQAPRGKHGLKSSCKACDAVRHRDQHVPRQRVPRQLPKDPASLKTCTKCGDVKPHSGFSLSRAATPTSNAVYQPRCKVCQAAAARQWFHDNKDRAKENRHRWNLAAAYGLTPADYQRLRDEQGGVCAICGNDEQNEHGRTGTKFRLAVDHCHTTGRVRGLLCQKCNRAVGLLNDDADLLRKAVTYLERK